MKEKIYKISKIAFLMILVFFVVSINNVFAENIDITEHTTYSHTKRQIIEKYNSMSPKFNYSSSVFDVVPSIRSPYAEGKLKEQVLDDTLNQINYFRWLSGLNSITKNEEYMSYSQTAAMIIAANDSLTHFPNKPSGMDEALYQKGFKATTAQIGNSSNISYARTYSVYRFPDSIRGYIDDVNNLEPNIGHRLSILDPLATSVSMGYAENSLNKYGAVNIFETYFKLNSDKFHAWPSAGYFPVELIDNRALWSINIFNSPYNVDGSSDPYVLLKVNGKEYKVSGAWLMYDDFYETYYFSVPDGLYSYLVSRESSMNYAYEKGKSVDIEFHSLKDKDGNTYVIKYTVNFFSLDEILVDEITFDRTDYTFNNKTPLKINATMKPANATNFKWESNDPTVATVDDTGTVTPVSNGSCIITCKALDEENIQAKCNIVVKFPEVSVSKKSYQFNKKGEVLNLTAKLGTEETTDVTWSSSNEKVASVSGGKVTSNAGGFSIITAQNEYGKAECLIYVSYPLTLSDGRKVYAGDVNFDKSMDDKDVEELNNIIKSGQITSDIVLIADINGDGNVNEEDKKLLQNIVDNKTFNINELQIDKLLFDVNKLYLKLNTSYTLSTTILPEDTTMSKELTWKSDNDRIASVKNGIITANELGSAVITAETKNGITAKCEVEVVNYIKGDYNDNGKVEITDMNSDEKVTVIDAYSILVYLSQK